MKRLLLGLMLMLGAASLSGAGADVVITDIKAEVDATIGTEVCDIQVMVFGEWVWCKENVYLQSTHSSEVRGLPPGLPFPGYFLREFHVIGAGDITELEHINEFLLADMNGVHITDAGLRVLSGFRTLKHGTKILYAYSKMQVGMSTSLELTSLGEILTLTIP